MKKLRSAVLVAGLFLGPALAGAEEDSIRVKGSDTIGGRAMPEIAEAYSKSRGGLRMVVEALGSSTAFVGLFDGSADIGESSRPINEKEQATAKELGLKLHEVVIGYDGVAVVVHPDNPVKELTVAQLSGLFSGKIGNWKDVGGRAGRVRLISRPTYSGTYAFFKEKALRRGNAKGPEEFGPATEYFEENNEILRTVAADPLAVSYIGLGWLSASVRAIPIVGRPGEPALVPSSETVRTGRYPLYRPLLMYVPTMARPAVLEFVRFVLAPEGSALMQRNGFIPPDASVMPAFLAAVRPPAPTMAAAAAPPATNATATDAARAVPVAPAPAAPPADVPAATRAREIVRIPFGFGKVSLGPEASATLDRLAGRLIREGQIALLTGHADAKGKSEANRSVALARANAVSYRLLQAGVPSRQVQVEEAAGADAPVASNLSTEGRARNRRVDIVLVPR